MGGNNMETILEMRGITKTFAGVTALSDVSLDVRRGEIHALVGENGAGKSTLMKVLSGVYPYGSYSGEILYEGKECRFREIADSEALGIVIIHQELTLVPLLSITENIFLGNEPSRYGIIDWGRAKARTRALLDMVGLKESPDTLVIDLGIGKQQLVEIAKALAKDVKLLILDEPTSSLNEADSAALLSLLLRFKEKGISSIIISHKLNEISQVADRITVIRDGSVIETLDCRKEQISEDRIIRQMVGRALSDRFPKRTPSIGEVIFSVSDWTVHHPQQPARQVVKNVSLEVKRGEIVGIAGLMGAGRTEFALSLFGRFYGQNVSGTVHMHGRKIDVSSVRKAVANKIAYVTEDRKQFGLVLEDSVTDNIALANLRALASKFSVIDKTRQSKVAQDYRRKTNIKCASVFEKAANLSGGNQQKVVISKWLFSNPEVLILDEPTRGIDVGAKYEIYTLINQLADEGKAVILISSEMPELLGLCDRIYVMNEGKLIDEMPASEASQERIMRSIVLSAGASA
jgi:putative multiple sugar transport system ATP-binding protein